MQDACERLGRMCETVVVTAGNEGCFVCQNGEMYHGECSPVVAADTTGAGDFFAGGYLYSWLQNRQISECVHTGNRFASAVVQVIGTNLPAEQWSQIRLDCGAGGSGS